MLFSEGLCTRVSIIPAKASINGKRSVEFVSRYEVRLYFLPGPVGDMKYWHISSRLNVYIQTLPQRNGGPNTEGYRGEQAKWNPVQGVYYLR